MLSASTSTRSDERMESSGIEPSQFSPSRAPLASSIVDLLLKKDTDVPICILQYLNWCGIAQLHATCTSWRDCINSPRFVLHYSPDSSESLSRHLTLFAHRYSLIPQSSSYFLCRLVTNLKLYHGRYYFVREGRTWQHEPKAEQWQRDLDQLTCFQALKTLQIESKRTWISDHLVLALSKLPHLESISVFANSVGSTNGNNIWSVSFKPLQRLTRLRFLHVEANNCGRYCTKEQINDLLQIKTLEALEINGDVGLWMKEKRLNSIERY